MSSRQTAPGDARRERRELGQARASRRGASKATQPAAGALPPPGVVQLAPLARQVADEAKAGVRRKARRHRGGAGRSSRQHDQGQSLPQHTRHQPQAGVGDARQAGVADQGHVLPLAQKTEHVGRLAPRSRQRGS